MDVLKKLKGRLIVSCQALEDEPLHDPYIMGKMALAAEIGGAAGIRANTVKDIREIKKQVDLPLIGIIKKNYGDHPVFITPTVREVAELHEEGVDIIAVDATGRTRPDGKSFEAFFAEVRAEFPDQLFMADCSTPEEAVAAERAGVDLIGTTLVGYTPYTEGRVPLEALREVISCVKVPVIAEGNMDTPEKAREALDLGAYAVVVGGAITRPQLITKKFADAMDKRA